MKLNGYLMNYYLVCKRELWFAGNGIHMEHNSELVELGKLIHETVYERRSKEFEELELEKIKIDFFDKKTMTVREVKKSKVMEKAHELQLKYYIYSLRKKGIDVKKGYLEYPKIRQRKIIEYKPEVDDPLIEEMEVRIPEILNGKIPEKSWKSYCKTCSYYELCWIE